jgi:hypothetical protein
MPGPSWIEYRLKLKIRPFIKKEINKKLRNKGMSYNPWEKGKMQTTCCRTSDNDIICVRDVAS